MYKWHTIYALKFIHTVVMNRISTRKNLQSRFMFGGDSGGVPHVPIPNTTVKPSSADGTWTAGSWESRTSPSKNEKNHDLTEIMVLFLHIHVF
jgi:hypothetical protein